MKDHIVVLLLAATLMCAAISAVDAAEPPGGANFRPPPDEYDWIQLTSDEWLKGELVSLYENELTFDSDHLGVLSLDWEDIRSFHSHHNYRVSVQLASTMTGQLEINPDYLRLNVDGGTRVYPRKQLVAITPTAYRELDNWRANATFGTNIRRGNADTIEYNLLAGVERRTPRSRVNLDYLGNFNEADGEQVANNHRINGNWDLFGGGRFFWRPVISQFYRDPFQNISRQGTLETGFGYEFIDNPRTEWQFSGGLGGNFIRYQSVEPGESDSETSPALSLGTDFETELTPWMDFAFLMHMTFLDDESGAYQHHVLSTLSTELIGNFDLDISFIWDRIGKPQQRADGSSPEKDDYRLMIGLGYEF
jgi:Protein of unknown function, DUF481